MVKSALSNIVSLTLTKLAAILESRSLSDPNYYFMRWPNLTKHFSSFKADLPIHEFYGAHSSRGSKIVKVSVGQTVIYVSCV